jgi:AraC-like DNA-binding protein
MWFGLIVYMLLATRQYGRWLRDNYADLEHKEVWQNFVVLGIFLLMYVIYLLDVGELIYEYAMEIILVILICYLLWRVETLSELNIPIQSDTAIAVNEVAEEAVVSESMEVNGPLSMRNNIGPLLKLHCEDTQLYLQHDISVFQLAQNIGTNRLYLSQYFSCQGMTYNAYINRLRIQHFINLYREAAATHQPVTAQQLAYLSGFRSYNTFSVAFKKMMGMTATDWMRNITEL